MKKEFGTFRVVLFSFLNNLSLFILKFIVFLLSGSAAIFSESLHSLSDTVNQLLLIYGVKSSKRKDIFLFPFGRGKEQYFWSLIVAFLFIGFSGLLSFGEGLIKMQHEYVLKEVPLLYSILIVSFFMDGSVLLYTTRTMGHKFPSLRVLRSLRETRDSTILVAFLEDFSSIIGISIAFIGIFLTNIMKSSIFDSIASISIGLLLITVGVLMVDITKDLIVGRGLSRNEIRTIVNIIKKYPEINKIIDIKGVYMGPSTVILGIDLNFRDGLSTEKIEDIIDNIENEIKNQLPHVKNIYIEAEE